MNILLLKYITNISRRTAKEILVATILIVLFSTQNLLADQKKEKSNHELKAELVYNFIYHTTWLGDESKVRNLCIMEDNPVIPYLNRLVKNNKNIVVIRKYENDYLEDCHVLFIDATYQGYANRLLFRIKSKPILTFSNIKNFAKEGGMVEYILRNNRVEFTLNIVKIKSSHLKISDRIVSISEVIN